MLTVVGQLFWSKETDLYNCQQQRRALNPIGIIMNNILAVVILAFSGILLLAQIVSTCNFKLAQKLGIQESEKNADSLLIRAERYIAYWDILTLCWLPIGVIAMMLEVYYWPIISIVGSSMYIDASGREAMKNLSFRHERLKCGGEKQKKLFFGSYVVMFIMGIVVLIYSILNIITRVGSDI